MFCSRKVTFQSRDADRHQVAVVAPIEEAFARRFFASPLKKGIRFIAVEMDLEGLAVQRGALQQLVDQVGLARRRREGRDEVLVRADVVDDRAGLDDAGPADQARNAEGALPVGRLLALEGRGAAVRPGNPFGAIVGRVDDDGVVGGAEIVEQLQQLADVAVRLHHAVGIEAEAGLALRLLLQMREDVHARGVEIAEPRFACAFLRLMKSFAAARNSSSIVSMRLVSSGPVFSMTCLPTRPNAGSTVASSRIARLALQDAARAERACGSSGPSDSRDSPALPRR